jgi:hypothetical protein
MGGTGQVGSSSLMWHAGRPRRRQLAHRLMRVLASIDIERHSNGIPAFLTSCPFKRLETEKQNSRREIHGLARL